MLDVHQSCNAPGGVDCLRGPPGTETPDLSHVEPRLRKQVKCTDKEMLIM